MKAAGCIVIGKTNTPEFGLGSHTFNEVFGATRNAYDPTRIGRRQQRRRGGRAGAAHAAGRRRQRLHGQPAQPGRPGTTSSACGRARAACRTGRRPTSGSRSSAPKARWRATCATWRGCSTCSPGFDVRAPLVDRRRERFADRLERLRRARAARASAGSATSAATCAMEPGIARRLRAGAAAARKASAASVEPTALGFSPEAVWQAWLVWRRWLVAARLAPLLQDPANRARIKPEALWEYDQAQGLSAAETCARAPSAARSISSCWRCSSASTCSRCRRAQVWPFDVALRWPATIAGRDDGHLSPLDGGGDLRDLRRPAAHQRAGRLRRRPACRWACS